MIIRKRFASVVLIAALVLTLFASCGDSGNQKSVYAQSPEELIKLYVSSMETGDGKGIFAAYGLLWDDSCEEYSDYPAADGCDLSAENVKYENLQGSGYEEALEEITQNWLNGDWAPSEFVYNAFDIQQMGNVSFTLTYDYTDAGEAHTDSEIIYLSIVETELGWFLVDGD